MRNSITCEHQAQQNLPPYHRFRSIGHNVGCVCEACFVHVERAISHYLPGFLPPDPLVQRIKELEQENADLRLRNEQLHGANTGSISRSNYAREPQRVKHDPATFQPVVIAQ
ncbi:MAG TPA: hypothetical protein PKD12_17905 [Nitrospira sp.]|nr:hypothetical protein [Nitrospira sp.]